MAKNRLTAYALLLLAFLLLGGMSLAVGDTTAHYENSDSWYMLMAPAAAPEAGSDCLVSGGQTVLLGNMEPVPARVPFTVGGAAGMLSWSVSENEYLTVEMVVDGVSYTDEAYIAPGEAPEMVTMCLIPTPAALETVHDAVAVSVEVTWTTEEQVLSGTFRVTLDALTELPTEPTQPEETDPEDTQPEETEPEETQPEETEPEETQPEETEPKETQPEETEPEETEPEETQPEETEPEETQPEETEPEETQPEETEPEETQLEETEPEEIEPEETEPEETEPEETQPEETQSEETEPEETQPEETQPEETEPEETEPEETQPEETEPEETQPEETEPEEESLISVVTIAAFGQEYGLPVTVSFPEGTRSVQLCMRDELGNTQQFAPFTRYSLDGGAHYYMLYYGGAIEAPVSAEQTKLTVLLDLSNVQLTTDTLILRAVGYTDGESLGKADVSVPVDPQLLHSDGSVLLLTEAMPLEIVLPAAWADYTLTYEISTLTWSDETGTTEVPVELSSEGMTAELTVRQNQPVVKIQTGEELPPAGTYYISIQWQFEEVCFARTKLTFFANYSSDAVS